MSVNRMKVRTRLAPSPTGMVHIGTVRTALFNYLLARQSSGQFILRIEDTDRARMVDGAVENLISVMSSLGIAFDEGPVAIDDNGNLVEQGEKGPYVQSQRLGIYQEYIAEMLSKKIGYYCFCSVERLDELRKEQIALKKPTMYDRHCRNLSAEEVQQKLSEFQAEGKNPVIRQAIPLEGQTEVNDLVYGKIVYENNTLDDQVLIKSDGYPTYHFAVVVDDHLMEITHVIRGEEWIPSTPKHILLYQAFGWEPPRFAHAPLIVNPDKTKLSKRQGDTSAESYLEKGYLPEALLNFLALLGWNPKTEQEVFSLDELVAQFDLAKVNKSGAVFDLAKLDWLNGVYIRNKTLPELTDLVKPYLQKHYDLSQTSPEFLQSVVGLEQERLKKLSDIVENTKYFFAEPDLDLSKIVWKKSNPEETIKNLNLLRELFNSLEDSELESIEKLEEHIKGVIAKNQLDNGSMLWPLRYLMTGAEKSPSPFEVTAVLCLGYGKTKVLQRIDKAISLLSSNVI